MRMARPSGVRTRKKTIAKMMGLTMWCRSSPIRSQIRFNGRSTRGIAKQIAKSANAAASSHQRGGSALSSGHKCQGCAYGGEGEAEAPIGRAFYLVRAVYPLV